MVKLLHFADAHIDIENYGRRDPESGLPLRVLDFLASLDEIINTAIETKVDMVIFAGDAYKDRSPKPTFQREWGKRIMRLSHAGIPTLLLTGNHDISPSTGRAHAIHEFDTLEVPHVRVINTPQFLKPGDLEDLPVQVIALPWISRSGLLASQEMSASDQVEINEQLGTRLGDIVADWLNDTDSSLPTILTAHASVEGAMLGEEQKIKLGKDLVLPPGLVKDSRLDYVALGHIHKPQNLNEGYHPPVIYPGSIERVDFGEARDKKFFVIANVTKGETQVEWRELKNIRPFIDLTVILESEESINEKIQSALPPKEQLKDAMVRFTIDYQREWESLIDETRLREMTESAFEFHLVKNAQTQARSRLPVGKASGSLSLNELLDFYWASSNREMTSNKKERLNQLAQSIVDEAKSDQ